MKNNHRILLLCLFMPAIKAISFIPPKVYIHPPEPLINEKRISSYPYISGDGFRILAKFYVDELQIPLNPDDVQDGDIIFVKSSLKDFFFTVVHPHIKSHYILITHNDDDHAPGNFLSMLDDPKLIAWFAQNADTAHPKLHPIPIGFANQYWPHGNPNVLNALVSSLSSIQKDKLLYLNITVKNNYSAREPVYNMFAHKSFCYAISKEISGLKPWSEYLLDLAQSKFVLSPEGNGLDSVRTWEALVLGTIPIVKQTTLDPMFKDLPVLIINDWDVITEEFLNNKYAEMSSRSYNKEKIYANYWLNQIRETQKNFLYSLDKLNAQGTK